MGPTSSGLDTLMALATNCPGNSVLLTARTCFVTTGPELVQPMARQETAPRSVAMALSVILFMTSLPFCFQSVELIFRVASGPGTESCPAPFVRQLLALQQAAEVDHHHHHRTVTVMAAEVVRFPAASRARADSV